VDRRPKPQLIDSHEGVGEAWSNHHAFLLDIAYRLLGSYTDAEDMVQEAFSRLLRTDLDPIEDLRAWLVVVVSRLCLDQLRSARVRREAYVGAWFPEPLIGSKDAQDPSEMVTLDESVRMAFLIVLERMSPAERVVFVLHDVFEFPFDKVASIVGRSTEACRQLASRARQRIKDEAGSARFQIDQKEQKRVIDAFIAACATGDVAALLPLLDPSVMGWADVGGMLPSVSAPTMGSQNVAEGVMRLFRAGSGTTLMAHLVNGEPGIIALRNGAVRAVLALTVKQGLITRLYAQADPRKLAHVRHVLDQGRQEADARS
jgi:RNA polymerase sigma-70 factor (ECF subfamily)